MDLANGVMAAGSLRVWMFRSAAGLIALTSDATGSCLPPEDGPWRFEKVAILGGDIGDEIHAIGLIEQFGFCCFDEYQDGEGAD